MFGLHSLSFVLQISFLLVARGDCLQPPLLLLKFVTVLHLLCQIASNSILSFPKAAFSCLVTNIWAYS
jgi:hypothetical protein